MPKKQKKRFHLKLRWALPLAAALVTGSIFLSLAGRRDSLAPLTETSHPSSERLDLSVLPAMASDVNLYDEGNAISVESGFVEITHSDGRKEKVTAQSPLLAGDRILVSDDGNAEIAWFEGSIVRLAGETSLNILQASYDAANINKTKIGLWANRGKIWAKVVSLVDGESEFIIRSNNAIAGVRGTTFNYILPEGGDPTVEVIRNAVFLKRVDGASADPESAHLEVGQSGSLKKDGSLELQTLDPRKLKEPYYAQNLGKDALAENRLRQSSLRKIRQWAEPLPGDPGYAEKQQLIKSLLSQENDPAQLKVLETRAAKIKVYEAIALMDPLNAEATLREISGKIQKSEWPEAKTVEIKVRLENDLRHMKRALGAVEKEGPGQAEGALRENQIKTKDTPREKKMSDERPSLRPASDGMKGPGGPAQTPPSAGVEPEQTKKSSKAPEVVISERAVSRQPKLTIPSREVSPIHVLSPEEKHELVLEKIETNRAGWVKRVEERLKRETEGENTNQEGVSNKKDDKTEAEKIGDPIEGADRKSQSSNDAEKTLPIDSGENEKAIPNEGGMREGSSPSQEIENGAVPSQSDQPSENGTGASNKPEERGQQPSPGRENGERGQEPSPGRENGERGQGMPEDL